MKKNTTNQKSIKLKFLLSLFISNSLLFILLYQESPTYQNTCQEKNIIRRGYVTLRVSAKLNTELKYNWPIKITNSKQSFVINHAYILKKIVRENSHLLPSEAEDFLIEIKQKDFSLLANISDLQFYPHEINLKAKKARSDHEILF